MKILTIWCLLMCTDVAHYVSLYHSPFIQNATAVARIDPVTIRPAAEHPNYYSPALDCSLIQFILFLSLKVPPIIFVYMAHCTVLNFTATRLTKLVRLSDRSNNARDRQDIESHFTVAPFEHISK